MLHRTLFTHVKLKRLCDELGLRRPQALGHLAPLYFYVGEHYYDGDITKMTDTDIAAAAEWVCSPAAFVNALVTVKLIDRTPGATRLHDWAENAPEYVQKRATRQRERDTRRRAAGWIPEPEELVSF